MKKKWRKASWRQRRSRGRKKPRLVFGLELETTGRTRREIANALNVQFGGYLEINNEQEKEAGDIKEEEAEFTLRFIYRKKHRKFEILDDESIQTDRGKMYRVEVVSSELGERDLDLVHTLCKTLKIAGATTNESCGFHIHFSSSFMNGPSLRRLLAWIYMYEPIIYRALNVMPQRIEKFCKPVNEAFIRDVVSSHYDLMTLMKKWYDMVGSGLTTGRLDPIRYHGLNLNPAPYKNHFELRYFNATLDPEIAVSYVRLAVFLLKYSLRSKTVPSLEEILDFRARVVKDPSIHRREFERALNRIGFKAKRDQPYRTLLLRNL